MIGIMEYGFTQLQYNAINRVPVIALHSQVVINLVLGHKVYVYHAGHEYLSSRDLFIDRCVVRHTYNCKAIEIFRTSFPSLSSISCTGA